MQVGLEGSLAREQIGHVPGCSVGLLGSAAGSGISTLAAVGSGAVVLTEADFEAELVTGTDGDGCEGDGSTARSSCSLSVSESTCSASGRSFSWLDVALVVFC